MGFRGSLVLRRFSATVRRQAPVTKKPNARGTEYPAAFSSQGVSNRKEDNNLGPSGLGEDRWSNEGGITKDKKFRGLANSEKASGSTIPSNKFKKSAEDSWNKSVAEDGYNAAGEHEEGMVEKAKEVTQKAARKVKKGFSAIKEKASDVVDAAKEKFDKLTHGKQDASPTMSSVDTTYNPTITRPMTCGSDAVAREKYIRMQAANRSSR
jgi:hypothetical protein